MSPSTHPGSTCIPQVFSEWSDLSQGPLCVFLSHGNLADVLSHCVSPWIGGYGLLTKIGKLASFRTHTTAKSQNSSLVNVSPIIITPPQTLCHLFCMPWNQIALHNTMEKLPQASLILHTHKAFILSWLRSSVGSWEPTWRNPLPLYTVSSLWQAVALATPQLWQQVCVSSCLAMSQELVPWIECSGTLPLMLFFQYVKPDIVNSIMEALDCYTYQWEMLCFLDVGDWNLVHILNIVHLDEWSSLQYVDGVDLDITITVS